MIQTWRIDTSNQTLVLGAKNNRLPSVNYWGAPLPENENLEHLYKAHILDLTGGMLDENPDLSICPEVTRSFPGQAGLIIEAEGGRSVLPKFCLVHEKRLKNSLVLTYKDTNAGLTYQASFEIYKSCDVIATRASLEADKPLHLHWFAAPVVPASQAASKMIDFSGRWCGEFQEVESPWNAGIRARENRTGRTGHGHFPGLFVPEEGATNTKGNAFGFHYAWSGGHQMIAEELPDGRRQIQFGHASGTELLPAKNYKTAPLYLTYSSEGLNGCAKAFQRLVRNHLVKFPDPKIPRPVHYNCWEAVYFNHNLMELQEIATLAATLGAERFVLDDGWFGTRDNDTRALSEWVVDPRKYPDGLRPLIDHVHQLGMSFGIWFEPEMISPHSALYKENPHWALGETDQILGRNQKALNMALSEVRDYLYESISQILTDNIIDYIKWDHNRVLPIPDAQQTRGTYTLMDRLRESFPLIEIESCASGGGRADFGILERTQRVWLSDSNDALERARIQHGSALFLPSCVTGSHVGPRVCHTSGRIHDIRFRSWIAAQRHMGFEMDPRELTHEETEILTTVTSWWKAERSWLMSADILRLDCDDETVFAELHMAEDKNKFVVFANKIDTSRQIAPRPLRLCGLESDKIYHIDLVNREDVHELSRGEPLIKQSPIEASGQYFMLHGIMLPWSFPNQVWVLKGEIVQ